MTIKYFVNPDTDECIATVSQYNIPRKRDFVQLNDVTYLVLSVCWIIKPGYEDVVHIHLDLPEYVRL